jgi:hypothetical protein
MRGANALENIRQMLPGADKHRHGRAFIAALDQRAQIARTPRRRRHARRDQQEDEQRRGQREGGARKSSSRFITKNTGKKIR